MTVRTASRALSTVVIGLVLAACALPATQEGFNEAWCEADLEFEAASENFLEIEDREDWLEGARAALVELQDDVRHLPAWPEAQEETAALTSTIEDVLVLIEAGAAGESIDEAEWVTATQAMLSARDAVRQTAGGCVAVAPRPFARP